MSFISKVYEVRVKVGQKLKSYHYKANTSKNAAKKGKKHGRIISVKKVDIQTLLGNRIENLNLDEPAERIYLGDGIFEDDLDIDGVLGLTKKTKRKTLNGRTFKDSEQNNY